MYFEVTIQTSASEFILFSAAPLCIGFKLICRLTLIDHDKYSVAEVELFFSCNAIRDVEKLKNANVLEQNSASSHSCGFPPIPAIILKKTRSI
jgi:hypothetical protein